MPEDPTTAASRQVSLETYIALVNRCAELRLNQDISNGSPFHARILIAKLFEVAKKSVQIVTGSLKDKTRDDVDIYGYAPVIAQAQKFLRDPSSSLTIVLEKGELDRGTENRFLKGVIESPDRNGTVIVLRATQGALGGSVPHFMLSDALAYRFEPSDAAQPENRTITAIGNFGNASFGDSLSGYFADITKYLSLDQHLSGKFVFPPTNKSFALQ